MTAPSTQRRFHRAGRNAAPALIVLTLAACDPGTIVIGVAGGASNVNAVVLALDDLDRTDLPPVDTVTVREGTNQAGPAIGAAETLVATPGLIGVVGHSNSAASIAASQIYNQAEVVQIAPNSTSPLYSRAGPFSFRLAPSDESQGPFLVGLLQETRPEGGGLALFYVNDDYGRGLREAFLASLDTLRYPVLLDLAHVEDMVRPEDIRQAAAAVSARPVDVILWLARGTVLSRYLPELRDVGPDIPILASDAPASYEVDDDEAHLWEGIRYVGLVDRERPAARDLSDRFARRFGRPPTGPDLLTYDAAALLLAGVAEGARSGEEMRRYLLSLGRERPAFEGVTGTISFDENGDIERPYVVEVIGAAGGT